MILLYDICISCTPFGLISTAPRNHAGMYQLNRLHPFTSIYIHLAFSFDSGDDIQQGSIAGGFQVHKAFHVRSGEIVAIKKAKETVADRDVGGTATWRSYRPFFGGGGLVGRLNPDPALFWVSFNNHFIHILGGFQILVNVEKSAIGDSSW